MSEKRFETPREFVWAVMSAAQKARSNIMEAELAEIGPSLFPKLWNDDWDNVLKVADKMVADGREPTGQDAMNLSYLLHRADNDDLLKLLDFVPLIQGYERFPDPATCMTRWAGVGL